MSTLSTWDTSCILPNNLIEHINKLDFLLNNINDEDMKSTVLSPNNNNNSNNNNNNNNAYNNNNSNTNNNNANNNTTLIDNSILSSLLSYENSLSNCLTNLNILKINYNNLDLSYNNVYSKTEIIRSECSDLLNQKDILLNKSKEISKGLVLFDNIDNFINEIKNINYLNNIPLEQENLTSNNAILPQILIPTINEQQYLNTLTTLEKYIIAIEEHVPFKDKEKYLSLLQSYHSKILGSLLTHFSGCLNSSARRLAIRMKESFSFDTISAMNVIEFRCILSALSWFPIIQNFTSSKYEKFNDDCLQFYVSNRGFIIKNLLRPSFTSLSTTLSNLDFAKHAIKILESVCVEEIKLYKEFFPSRDLNGIDEMLIDCCGLLYSSLRPAIVRISNLEVLCELSLLNEESRIMHVGQNILKVIADVQERIVYTCQALCRDEISNCYPTAQDLKALSYSESGKFVHFKTLDVCLSTLAKVFHCVEMKVFEGLARELIAACTSNLIYLNKKLATINTIDADLCLISHLLLLREQIAPFPIDFSITEKTLDFSTLRANLGEVLRGKVSLRKLSFKTFADGSVPAVLESQSDAKKDMEKELKAACERVIFSQTTYLLANGGIFNFVSNVNISAKEKAPEYRQLLTPLLDDLHNNYSAKMKQSGKKIAFYLNNPSLESILLRPIKGNIRECFDSLRILMDTLFEGDTILFSKIPTLDSE